ncbi:hypothetical protein [uncultured Jannaschia sp.]|uniref:lipopolysaccharide biosynthesis protein n=1 Tax=uncultured Jannaschia sp. TaxID=293347 RepID=UPI0026274275|nr:hypothetical protein [uncultured Jannaschia sp.]
MRTLASNTGAMGFVFRLIRQPTLVSAMTFAVSGAAFALGNLLLARQLPVEAFGRVALVIALFNVLILLAPLGIDQQIARRRIDPGIRLLALLLASALAMGVAVAVTVVAFGGFQASEAAWLVVMTLAGCVTITASMTLRMRQQPWAALTMATIASFILLTIGLATLAFDLRDAEWPLALFAIGNVAAAIWGWSMLQRSCRVPEADREPVLWREAMSLLGIAFIGAVSLQIERIVIPIPLDLRDLALFSVLASVAIFPFRLLTAGVNFTVVPRLKAASSVSARYRVLRSELLLLGGIVALAWPVIILLAPPVTTLVTDGGYAISYALATAACCNGTVKILMVVPRAVLTACGSDRDLAALNRLGIVWVVLAVGGAFVGAQGGLTGLIWGVSLGGLLATLPAANLARRRLTEGL